MEILKPNFKIEIVQSFLTIASYAVRYFDNSNLEPIDFLSKILLMTNLGLQHTTLLVKICFCAPFSNSKLKRIFSQINLI